MQKIIVDEQIEIQAQGITADSRKVKPGYVFCAIPAFLPEAENESPDLTSLQTRGWDSQQNMPAHGIAYAGEAIKQGAACILWQPTAQLQNMPGSCDYDDGKLHLQVALVKVENLHQKLSDLAAQFFDRPSQKINIIGMTGTNGKTSSCHYTAQLLGYLGKKTAVAGTLGNGIFPLLQETTHTTLQAIELQQLLADFVQQQAEYVVMEVSSHALQQHRVAAVAFDTAVYTNLSRDHLDYHRNMEDYLQQKLKLFKNNALRYAIINMDDKYAAHFLKASDKAANILQYAKDSKHLVVDLPALLATDIDLCTDGIRCHLQYYSQSFGQSEAVQTAAVKLPLMGLFNLENAMAAAAVLLCNGYELSDIAAGLSQLKSVRGRMQPVTPQQQHRARFIIDYAHTPDALKQALRAIRQHLQQRGLLWCVFGCGGDRDKGKRAAMAKVAGEYADRIIVTSDNPRTESPQAIIDDICRGFAADTDYQQEVDRKQAIARAVEQAGAGDIVLIAGKGHEQYQEINGIRHPFSDLDVCRELLAA